MKPQSLSLITTALALAGPVLAQPTVPQNAPPLPSQSAAPFDVVPEGALQRTPAQLDQLLGPIALYPDALIALILPSATEPSDIVLAARYFNSGGDLLQIDAQSWDDSVKALAHYPDIVKWMDENLVWTKQVGEAFLTQPAEVMKSVQRLRAAARAAGTLVDTPQQQIYTEGDAITIVPTQPDTIYIPYYDPDVVYVSRDPYYSGPFLTFSAGYAAGFWLGYDFDWNHRRILVIDRRERERYWREHHDWRRTAPAPGTRGERDPVRQPWHPNPSYVRPSPRPGGSRPSTVVVRPSPVARPSPFARETQRPPEVRGNPFERTGRPPENREAPTPLTDGRRFSPTRPEHVQTSPAPGQAQPLTPAPTIYNRGNRGPEVDAHSPRENRERVPTLAVPVNPGSTEREKEREHFAPVHVQPNPPNAAGSPPVVHQPRIAPPAPAAVPPPQVQAQPAPAPAPTPQQQDDGGRGRRNQNDR